jgi:hypothetical protein
MGGVHGSQSAGAEADIVVFDTVNASNCAWPMDEWQRLVKVGLSRARESINFLASESEMEEPCLRPLRKLMTPAILIQEQGNLRWQAISSAANRTAGPNRVGEEVTQYRNACMAQQIADRKQMSPILSR